MSKSHRLPPCVVCRFMSELASKTGAAFVECHGTYLVCGDVPRSVRRLLGEEDKDEIRQRQENQYQRMFAFICYIFNGLCSASNALQIRLVHGRVRCVGISGQFTG